MPIPRPHVNGKPVDDLAKSTESDETRSNSADQEPLALPDFSSPEVTTGALDDDFELPDFGANNAGGFTLPSLEDDEEHISKDIEDSLSSHSGLDLPDFDFSDDIETTALPDMASPSLPDVLTQPAADETHADEIHMELPDLGNDLALPDFSDVIDNEPVAATDEPPTFETIEDVDSTDEDFNWDVNQVDEDDEEDTDKELEEQLAAIMSKLSGISTSDSTDSDPDPHTEVASLPEPDTDNTGISSPEDEDYDDLVEHDPYDGTDEEDTETAYESTSSAHPFVTDEDDPFADIDDEQEASAEDDWDYEEAGESSSADEDISDEEDEEELVNPFDIPEDKSKKRRKPPVSDDDEGNDDDEKPKKERKPRKKPQSGKGILSVLGKLFKPVIGVYKAAAKFVLGALVWVLDLLGALPLIGGVFKLLSNIVKSTRGIAESALGLIIILALGSWWFFSVPSSDKVELPDDAEVKVSSMSYDKDTKTVTGKVLNNSPVITEVSITPRIEANSPTLNPLTWIAATPVGTCETVDLVLDIDATDEFSAKCSYDDKGLFPRATAEVTG